MSTKYNQLCEQVCLIMITILLLLHFYSAAVLLTPAILELRYQKIIATLCIYWDPVSLQKWSCNDKWINRLSINFLTKAIGLNYQLPCQGWFILREIVESFSFHLITYVCTQQPHKCTMALPYMEDIDNTNNHVIPNYGSYYVYSQLYANSYTSLCYFTAPFYMQHNIYYITKHICYSQIMAYDYNILAYRHTFVQYMNYHTIARYLVIWSLIVPHPLLILKMELIN